MNFWKSAKGGVGIFNPRIYIPDFWNFKQGFLSRKLIQKSNFRVQGVFFQQLYWEKLKPHTLKKALLNPYTGRATLPLNKGGERAAIGCPRPVWLHVCSWSCINHLPHGKNNRIFLIANVFLIFNKGLHFQSCIVQGWGGRRGGKSMLKKCQKIAIKLA